MSSDLGDCESDPNKYLNLSEDFVRDGFLISPEKSTFDGGSSGEEQGYGYNPDIFMDVGGGSSGVEFMGSDLEGDGFGACKEDMRLYVKDLWTRTKIEEDPEMKRQALASLHEVANEDEKFVVVVMEVGEVIHPLVSFLCSLEMEVQEEAARVLRVVAGETVRYRDQLTWEELQLQLSHGPDSGKGAFKSSAAHVDFGTDK
ncbi:hypothetical protein NL676_029168 [Syzygium grande]|nr:hypothetical protein NL676_029168 [Syzygium grande]